MGEPCDTGGPVPGAAALVDDGEAVYMYCEVGAGGWKYDSNGMGWYWNCWGDTYIAGGAVQG